MSPKSIIAIVILIGLFAILFVGPNVPALQVYVNPAGAALVVITIVCAIALVIDKPRV